MLKKMIFQVPGEWRYPILVLIFFVIITTIITNIFVGGRANWIGYFGSFFGSIIGGLVSGYITLKGVKITIEHGNKKSFLDTLPDKLLKVESYYEIIKDMNKNYIESQSYENNAQIRSFCYQMHVVFTERDIVKESATVNFMTFRTMQNIKYLLGKMMNYGMNPVNETPQELQTLLHNSVYILGDIRTELINEYNKAPDH